MKSICFFLLLLFYSERYSVVLVYPLSQSAISVDAIDDTDHAGKSCVKWYASRKHALGALPSYARLKMTGLALVIPVLLNCRAAASMDVGR